MITKELETMAAFSYQCMNTTSGFIEYVSVAPAATGKCPKCGGITKREKQ